MSTANKAAPKGKKGRGRRTRESVEHLGLEHVAERLGELMHLLCSRVSGD